MKKKKMLLIMSTLAISFLTFAYVSDVQQSKHDVAERIVA